MIGEDLGYNSNKPNLNILYWVIFLLRDWTEEIKKKDFLRDYEMLKTKAKSC